MARRDTDEERLAFVLAAQDHCDEYLSRIADPMGKSVVVLGAGAGTEMLWCLRHGAREVVGIDLAVQSPAALSQAAQELGLGNAAPFSLERLAIEDAPSLGRRFDLVLSNNVFEHLPHLNRTFEVCAQLVQPARGRIAIFTDPLYYSSVGSHLPIEPWEHLWGDPEAVRRRLLDSPLPSGHPLEEMDLGTYLDDEISLNKMRLSDFLEGIRTSGLVILSLGLVRDRNLGKATLHRGRQAVRDGGLDLSPADLALEGIWAELALLDGPAADPAYEPSPPYVSVVESRRHRKREQLEDLELRLRDLRGEIARLYVDTGDGFSQEASLATRIEEAEGEISVEYDVSPWDSIRSLRWDPTENQICDLALAAVTYQDATGSEIELDLARVETNGVGLGEGHWRFDTLDPMVLLPVSGRVRWIRVHGQRRLSSPELRLHELGQARREVGALRRERDRLVADETKLQEAVEKLRQVLAEVEASPSFRLGRRLTAPARWLRARVTRQ